MTSSKQHRLAVSQGVKDWPEEGGAKPRVSEDSAKIPLKIGANRTKWAWVLGFWGNEKGISYGP